MKNYVRTIVIGFAGLSFAATTANATCVDAWWVYQRSTVSAAYASSDGLAGNAHHKGPIVCTWARSRDVVWAKQTAIENCNRQAAAKHLGHCTIAAWHI